MTDEQKRVIEELRSEGYAVAIIPPNDIPEGVDADNIEDLMTNRGYDAL
jgi:hypothetical protein